MAVLPALALIRQPKKDSQMKLNQYNTTIACNIPRKVSLRNPFDNAIIKDDKGDTLDFFVYGMHSDMARNAINDRQRKKAEQDDDTKIGAEYLAAITMGWSHNIEDDNGQIEYSQKAAVKLYIEQDWIARQVLTFSTDLGNFNPRLYEKQSAGSKKGRGSIASPKELDAAELLL
jgi:hypothetical protein